MPSQTEPERERARFWHRYWVCFGRQQVGDPVKERRDSSSPTARLGRSARQVRTASSPLTASPTTSTALSRAPNRSWWISVGWR